MLITNKPTSAIYKNNNNMTFGVKVLPVIPFIKASENHINLQRTTDGKVCGLVYTKFIDPLKFNLMLTKKIELPKFVLKLLNAVTKPPKRTKKMRYY